VIVGSVDGNRIWSSELQQSLTFVEWSPDGKILLFSTTAGAVLAYDSSNGTELVRTANILLTVLTSYFFI